MEKHQTILKLILLVSLLLAAAVHVSAHTYTVVDHHDVDSRRKHSHRCVHDEVMEQEKGVAGGVHEQMSRRALYEPEVWQRIKAQKEMDGKRSLSDVHATFEKIRISFRTEYILKENEETSGRTCYAVGQSYKRGNPASLAVTCSELVTNDCYGTCTKELVVTDTMINAVKNTLLPLVKQTLQNMLATRKLEGKVTFNSNQNCGAEGGVPIPDDLKSGIDGSTQDTVMFVTMRPTTAGVLGWATTCLIESGYGRPVMGHLNLSPLILSQSSALQLGVAVHETTHALGFSSSRFDSFVDQNGVKRSQVTQQVTKTFQDAAGKTRTKTITNLVTPELLSQARKHFACNSTAGVPLEEIGGTGTAGSHFEKRVFLNELMVGAVSWFNPSETFAISQFTLALLQDSGWYKSNFSFATPLTWGQGMGCSFISDRCENWNVREAEGYYCSTSYTSSQTNLCTFNHRGKGYCDIRTYTSSLGYYEHLNDAKQGGPDELMDYCPIVYRFSNGKCSDTTNSPMTGERYGSDSACFDSNARVYGTSGADRDARCFQYACNKGQLEIIIAYLGDDKVIKCPKDQSYKIIQDMPTGFTGYVTCPKNGYTILCESYTASGTDTPTTSGGTGNPLCDWFKLFCSAAHSLKFSYTLLAAVFVLLAIIM